LLFEKNSTIVFPLPLDLIAPLMEIMRRQAQVSVSSPLTGLHEEALALPR
jgi:hypothetical protein